MDVPVELSRILISELGDQQFIFLREKDGERSFPILIGTPEAVAIDRRLKGHRMPRPMTHDLLANVIEAMGGNLEKVIINDLRAISDNDHSQTFFATLFIRRDSEVIEIDSRPSDAIALTVGLEAPIFVAEEVFDSILNQPPSTMEERIEVLRKRMEMLRDAIAAINQKLDNEEFLTKAPPEVVQYYRVQLDEMNKEYEAIDQVLKKTS